MRSEGSLHMFKVLAWKVEWHYLLHVGLEGREKDKYM